MALQCAVAVHWMSVHTLGMRATAAKSLLVPTGSRPTLTALRGTRALSSAATTSLSVPSPPAATMVSTCGWVGLGWVGWSEVDAQVKSIARGTTAKPMWPPKRGHDTTWHDATSHCLPLYQAVDPDRLHTTLQMRSRSTAWAAAKAESVAQMHRSCMQTWKQAGRQAGTLPPTNFK